jgi:hypothetical protein
LHGLAAENGAVQRADGAIQRFALHGDERIAVAHADPSEVSR